MRLLIAALLLAPMLALADHQSSDVQTFLWIDHASTNNVAEMQALVAHGFDPRGARDYDYRTAQHLAAAEDSMDAMVYLIETLGLNPNPVDRFKGTPITDARRHSHPQMERYLRNHEVGELCCFP